MLLLFPGVVVVPRRVGYLRGHDGEGRTNFQQSFLPLSAEAGMQLTPSSLLGCRHY